MKTSFCAILMLLCIPAVSFAADLPQTIQTKDGFAICLPADWVAIPKDVLEGYGHSLAKIAPNAERQTYDYGFQLPKKNHWFEYPYILIQVKRTGRAPEAQLKSIRRMEQQMQQAAATIQQAMSSVVSNAKIGEMINEPARHILWTQLSLEGQTIGTVKALIAAVLTEEGSIGIYGYSPAADFEKYAPVFEAIARATIVADNIKYRSHLMESLPLSAYINWEIVLRGALTGGIVGALVGTIVVVVKARRKKKVSPG